MQSDVAIGDIRSINSGACIHHEEEAVRRRVSDVADVVAGGFAVWARKGNTNYRRRSSFRDTNYPQPGVSCLKTRDSHTKQYEF